MRTKRIGISNCPRDYLLTVCIHDSPGYLAFHVNFGRSPTLSIDHHVRTPSLVRWKKDAAEYVKEVASSLKSTYDKVGDNIQETHKANKRRHDNKE